MPPNIYTSVLKTTHIKYNIQRNDWRWNDTGMDTYYIHVDKRTLFHLHVMAIYFDQHSIQLRTFNRCGGYMELTQTDAAHGHRIRWNILYAKHSHVYRCDESGVDAPFHSRCIYYIFNRSDRYYARLSH